jgi:glutamine synthetase
LTLVNLPTVNAYKRLEDYTFAPNRVSWGIDNRTVAVRVPLADSPSTRLELRAASSDANPYLIMAGAIASGADGLARELEPQQVTEGDAYQDPDLELLPTSLAAAAEVFERSPFCKEQYGETFVETFTILARREQAAFLHHVTDWERDRYLAQA